jgi:HPr kinase/phosphorylase
MSQSPGVAVRALLQGWSEHAGLTLDLLAGAGGLERRITSPHVQKTGLALAGFDEYLQPGRVLIFGESEIRFLESLSAGARLLALQAALRHDFPCILITGGFTPPSELPLEAERAGLPLLHTTTVTPTAIGRLSAWLDDALAERTVVHGVLLDVLGLGVLLTGDSGIGKSECALDLIVRGHRLIADDTVDVKRPTDTVLIGSCPELTRNHMELRGLGIINVRELFGVSSTRSSKRIELVVQLERWEAGREYDRLGIDDAFFDLLGVRISLIRMPVAPGRNIAILVEVAARNQLLRARGHHAARLLAERLNQALLHGQPEIVPLADDEEEDEHGEHGGRQ